MLKKKAINHEVPYGKGFDFDSVEIPDEAELIAFTHNESSTGVMLDMKEIERFKDRYPDKLIAVDVVSSLPYPEIDFSKIDLTYFSVQKGFGLPAGLGVCIISPEAFQRSAFLQRKGLNVGSYHNFQYLNKYHLRAQTPETPNVFNLFLLHKVVADMQKTDLNKMRKDLDARAKIIYDYFESHPKYNPFVEDTKDRSPTMIVIRTYGDSTDIIKHLKKDGMIIGGGYGDLKDQHIRIANFPSHTMEEVKGIVDVMKTYSV
jgi:phosphoserine aminotransferase